MPEASIGIIGGSGLYEMEGMTSIETVEMDTPFGKPSDSITIGTLQGSRVAFLPRHGRGHRYSPTHLPVRANIYAMKTMGVERIISISAVGSLKEELHPLHMVVPDQLIDRTYRRVSTFFDGNLVAHIGFAQPFCPHLSHQLHQAALAAGATVHQGGTYVVMEGPAFSTLAESRLYRSWGADIIGMTALPETKLAREAEICYAILACVTDYDCWHESEGPVTVEMIVGNLMKNVDTSRQVLAHLIPQLGAQRTCPCASALKDAIITDRRLVAAEEIQKLMPLVGKYID